MASQITRRSLLQRALVSSIGVLLASCAPRTVEKIVKETVVTKETVVVEKLVTPTPAPVSKATIQFMSNTWWEGPSQAKEFMQLHPEVTVEVIPTASQKQDAMIAAGTPPDLLRLGECCPGADVMWKKGLLQPMKPFMDADKFDTSAYQESVLKIATFNGELYGIGDAYATEVLFYNKTLIEEAGVEVPDGVFTWQDYATIAKAVTKGEGIDKIWGCLPPTWFSPQYCFFWQNNAEVYSADMTKCLADSPASIETLEFLTRLVSDGYCPTPLQVSGAGQSTGQLFSSNKAALLLEGQWFYGSIPANAGFEVGAANLKGKSMGTWLHTALYFLAKASKGPRWAWEFLKYYIRPEQCRNMMLNIGSLSQHKATLEDLLENPPSTINPGLVQVWRAAYEVSPSGKSYSGVAHDEILANVWGPTLDEMWAGKLTPAATGEAITEAANAIFAKQQ